MLAINTAFMQANLALNNGKVFIKEVDAKSKHSENVLKTIDELCQAANMDILDVGTVAVVTGPGSFTGLRIGTAIAKALGCANEKLKFISVSSLSLMAYIVAKNNYNNKKPFVCVLNALSDLFFVSYFDDKGIKIEQEKMITKQEYLQISLPKFGLVGDLDDKDIFKIEITGIDLLEFAKIMEKNGEFTPSEELLPVYLRASQAEDNFAKKNQKKK